MTTTDPSSGSNDPARDPRVTQGSAQRRVAEGAGTASGKGEAKAVGKTGIHKRWREYNLPILTACLLATFAGPIIYFFVEGVTFETIGSFLIALISFGLGFFAATKIHRIEYS